MVLSVLLVAAGGVTIHASFITPFPDRTPAEAGKTAGAFAIINSVFYVIDAYFGRLDRD